MKRIAWSGMGVVSFCEKVTEHARRCGVTNILDVRYFPDLPLGRSEACFVRTQFGHQIWRGHQTWRGAEPGERA